MSLPHAHKVLVFVALFMTGFRINCNCALAFDEPTVHPNPKVAAPPAGMLHQYLEPVAQQEWVVSTDFFPDGKRLATACPLRGITVWSTITGERLFDVKTELQPSGRRYTNSVRISPDGSLIAALIGTDAIGIWDARDGTQRFRVDLIQYRPKSLSGSAGVVFAPDGKSVGAVLRHRRDRGSTIMIWSTLDAAVVHELQFANEARFAFFGDDDRIVVSAKDPRGGLSVQSLTGRGEAEFLPYGWANRLVHLPCGRTAVGSYGRDSAAVTLLDLDTGKLLLKLALPAEEHLRDFAISPNGKLIACALPDRVTVYETASQKVLAELRSEASIYFVQFSPDSTALATDCPGTSILWDIGLLPQRAKLQEQVAIPFETAWRELASPLPQVGVRAMHTFLCSPKDAVLFLSEHQVRDGVGIVRKLVSDLDSPQFAVRQRALPELANYAPTARPLLNELLLQTQSAEIRARLRALLEKDLQSTPEMRRQWRLVQILEAMDTVGAYELLKTLAEGDQRLSVTSDAIGALARWNTRQSAAEK